MTRFSACAAFVSPATTLGSNTVDVSACFVPPFTTTATDFETRFFLRRQVQCVAPASRRNRSNNTRHRISRLGLALDDNTENDNGNKQFNELKTNGDEEAFLRKELSHLESLEELLSELEDGDHPIQDVDNDLDEDTWMDLFGSLPEEVDDEELAELERMGDTIPQEEYANENDVSDEAQTQETVASAAVSEQESSESTDDSSLPINDSLESALLQGVVPADAGVGSGCLPGDYGFDPLDLASKDIIGKIQRWFWNQVPGAKEDGALYDLNEKRPLALVLRDLREAEIRHGRLAMLATIFWPLQEMLDRLLLEDYQFGSTTIIYGGVTLPYFSLLMTAIMLLLGYLDIYANAIKDVDSVGEAFLPGDCFWDPLRMLEGAPPTMKRNMQERELLNGRMAMLAFAVFCFEEATTHQPLITIPGNELLFQPAYQIPYIQEWLDSIFASPSPTFTLPDGPVDFTEAAKEVLQEESSDGYNAL